MPQQKQEMIERATLLLAGKEYELLYCSYSLRRDTDSKGRPSSGLYGGTITLKLKSSPDTSIIEAMTSVYKPVDGKISFKQNEAEYNTKDLLFERAYIISFTETFNVEVPYHMFTEFTVTAEKITMGKAEYKNEWPK